jgi:hypothetical protein
MSALTSEQERRHGRALIETDSIYFELGARVTGVRGASFAVMPGFERTAAGCVVQRIDLGRMARAPRSWFAAVEDSLLGVGTDLARLYVLGDVPTLTAALLERGYHHREEIGFVASADFPPPSAGVTLRPVLSAADWAAKRLLHEATCRQSDGYDVEPTHWVELERRKSADGGMRCYLIEVGGEPRAAVATMGIGDFLRLKNIIVHPAFRHRGLGLETVRWVGELARREGRAAFGCFGIAGERGEALYRRAGLRAVTSQFEWTRSLEADARRTPAGPSASLEARA